MKPIDALNFAIDRMLEYAEGEDFDEAQEEHGWTEAEYDGALQALKDAADHEVEAAGRWVQK